MAEPGTPSSVDPSAEPADASDPRVGTSLGKYRVMRRLGKGGMGLVYEAFDTLLKRHVAVKVLSDAVAEQQDAMRRFLMEARAAGRLNHPNVVAIHDVEQLDGTYFIVMELVRGGSAQEFLDRRGPFDWPEATQVVADVCRGLAAAHAAGLVHRDIKPSNIMRSADGVVKLADFGLAKITTSQSSIVPVTATGYTVGTPDYMSPEQCRAETIDARSDVYSLGATYYALLTGKPPFQGSGPLQVMFAHCSNVVPDPRALNKAIPERCTAIIRRAMAKFANERHGDVAALLAELEEVLALVPKEKLVPATQWTNVLLEPLTPAGQSSQKTLVPPEVSALLAPPQQPGEIGRLGPYRVLKILGEGGMGMVFQAEDPGLERLVALKLMKPDKTANDVARQRFLQEAKAAAKVQHENIVTIYQVGEDRGIPYLAMQFLHGESLDERLRRERKLPIAEVVRIGREMAEGLAAAHQRGLMHRDIKPPNVWLEAPSERVKILDFGLARNVAGGSQHLTRTGLVMGTPGYMAPEQARSNQPLDHRCDLFSLGCVLYHLTAGQEPFRRDDAMATLLALALEEPPSIPELRPDAPPALVALIQQLLAKSPTRRPATARAVSDALRDLERHGATVTVPASVPVGGGASPAKLAEYGLTFSEEVPGIVLPSSTAVLPTPPSGHPQTTLVEGLPPLPDGPVCQRCGARMESTTRPGWCLACGYHPTLAEKPIGPDEAKQPSSLVWLYILLAGMVPILGAALFANFYLPRDSMTRVWCSTIALAVGLAAVAIGHVWAFFATLSKRDDHLIFHYLDPTKLWNYTYNELPRTQKALWTGCWGGVTVLCAVFVVGGLSYWWVMPKRWAPRPAEQESAGDYAAVGDGQKTPEAELAPKDGDPSIDEPRITREDCYVIGYELDDAGNIVTVAVATQRDGKWLYGGMIRPEPEEIDPARYKELRDRKKVRALTEPATGRLDLPGKFVWVEPKVSLRVSFLEMDPKGELKDPRIARPEEVKKGPAKESKKPAEKK